MNEQKRQERMEKMFDLADKYLDEALANGQIFSEALCNWASRKAEQELGTPGK